MGNLTARRAIIIVLVAVCCLLVVPGIAGASVKAKYRAEYKARVNALKSEFTVWARAYDSARDQSIQTADAISSAADHDLQLLYEQQARQEYVDNLGLPEDWNITYAKTVNAFKAKATRYFASAAQQKHFKTACDQLKAGARKLILLANTHVYDSFQELSTDPPDYVTQQAMLDFGDKDAAAGHEGFDKQVAALKALL